MDDQCPMCVGRVEGQWVDLCDDHLRAWLRPALEENDRRRALAEGADQ